MHDKIFMAFAVAFIVMLIWAVVQSLRRGFFIYGRGFGGTPLIARREDQPATFWLLIGLSIFFVVDVVVSIAIGAI